MRQILFAGIILSALSPVIGKADSSWYLGMGAGTSSIRISDDFIPLSSASASSLSANETSTGYKLFLGFQINPNFAIEGGWIDLGTVSATRTLSAPSNGTATGKLKSSGLYLDLVGMLPISDGFSVFGRLGALASSATDYRSVTGSIALGGNAEVTDTTTQAHYGIGLQYDMNKEWGVRTEWERSKVSWHNNGTPDVDLISINIVFKY